MRRARRRRLPSSSWSPCATTTSPSATIVWTLKAGASARAARPSSSAGRPCREPAFRRPSSRRSRRRSRQGTPRCPSGASHRSRFRRWLCVSLTWASSSDPDPGGSAARAGPHAPRCHRPRPRCPLLRHQPRPLLGRDRLALRPRRQSLLAGAGRVRVHAGPAPSEPARRAAGVQDRDHQLRRPRHRDGGGADRRRDPRRPARPRTQGAPLPAARGGHRRHRRLPDRLRSAARGVRPPARGSRRRAVVGAAEHERPERALPGGGVRACLC